MIPAGDRGRPAASWTQAPDVAAARVNPLIHFLQFGSQEGRSAFADGVWGQSIFRRSVPRFAAENATSARNLIIHPLDLRHHRLRLELRDDRVEMLEIVDLEVDLQLGEIRGAARHADIVDVAVVLGDHLRDLRERARLVDRIHLDARRKALRAFRRASR